MSSSDQRQRDVELLSTPVRPLCPTCSAPIHRMQRTPDIVAAYPCCCWLSPATAQRVAERVKAARIDTESPPTEGR